MFSIKDLSRKALFILFLFNATFLFAHGDLHEQITIITQQIKETPTQANLYLKRGQLYAQHSDFEKATEDYQKARTLDPKMIVTDLLLAKLLLANEQAEMALKSVNLFLKEVPDHANALLLRAEIHQELHMENLAKADFIRAIEKMNSPMPQHYISLAETCLRTNRNDLSEAIFWLKKGQSAFGYDIVLKEKEIELLSEYGHYEAALLGLDEILNRFQRQEKWLFQKGSIHEKANQPKLALAYYQSTLAAIESLPKRLQMTSIMKELKEKTTKRIKSLS